jgi:hypothetical protein
MEEPRVAELERKIRQQVLEIDFLRRALPRVEDERRLRAARFGASSTTNRARSESRESTRHRSDVCAAAGSRAGFYRAAAAPRAESVKLRDQRQGVALEWPT